MFAKAVCAALSLLIALSFTSSPTLAQSALPTIPGCICSRAVEVQFPATSPQKKVFAANCVCGPQYCAVAWNDTISLQCTPGAPADGARSNCADFTKLKVGNYGQSMDVGLFRIDAVVQDPQRQLEVVFDDIATNPVTQTPNGLRTGSSGMVFIYPSLYRRAEIDLAAYNGPSGLFLVTGKNVLELFRFNDHPVDGTTIRVVVEHPDGIKSLRFTPASELLVFEVCALNPM